MKIAIDITPISGKELGGHKVRGVGKYIEMLQNNLPRIDKKNEYVFFDRADTLTADVDLVHYPYFDPFFITLPYNSSHSFVVTVHDLTPIKFPKQFPAGIKGKLRWQAQKFLLKKSRGIIADSESAKSDVISFTGIKPEKIHVVYLAVEDSFKRITDTKKLETVRKKYKLPDSFVLYVGDITWNKNLPALVEAIKKINLTLVMVGKSIAEKDFDKTNPWNRDRTKVHKLIKDDERFMPLGFISDEDLVALYNLATVAVMPSLYEGFGLPVLEAMSCGIPVITSQEGSLPEVGGEAAYYVDVYDVNSIADGIGELFFSPELQRQHSKKGLTQSNKFSIEKSIKDLVSVYESVSK